MMRGERFGTSADVLLALPCLLVGGTEHQTLSIARALVSAGRRVVVLVYFESTPSMVSAFEQVGVRVILLGWSRSIGAPRFVPRLAAVLRTLSPRVLHVQYMAPGLLPILAGRLAGVRRIVATVHQACGPQAVRARTLLRLAAHLVHRFACVSQAVERSWFGTSVALAPAGPWPTGRSHATIPNAIEVARVDAVLARDDAATRRERLGVETGLVVGTVARLVEVKGVDTLLRAFARVVRDRPATLLLVGGGSEEHELRALAQALGIAERIVWRGIQSWESAILSLSVMDVVVVPSRSEGFGLVAAEAMACARPVVASAVGGLADLVVEGSTGFTVPAESSDAFADRMGRLLDVTITREAFGRAGRVRVVEHFNLPDYVARIRVLHDV